MRNQLKSIVSDILVKEAGQQYVDSPFGLKVGRVPIEEAAEEVMPIYGYRNLHVGDNDVTAELGLKNKFDGMAQRRALASLGAILLGTEVGMSNGRPISRILGATAGVGGGIFLGMKADARRNQADSVREYAPSASISDLIRGGGYHNMSERQI